MESRGCIYTYGLGKNVELGNNLRDSREILPFKIEGIPSCCSACAGGSFSLILTKAGEIYTCGKSKHGRNGSVDSSRFVKIKDLPKITQISAVYWHSLAVDDRNII